MMIGEEKLLFTIGVPAKHQGRPLKFSDANVLDIAVAKSWNGETVTRQLKKTQEKVGHQPDYVISDNASILKKGIREANMSHQRDISHSLGMFLERTYKKESDFEDYTKSMHHVKTKHCMTKEAYLLPPSQRTIARFMNISSWVKWSDEILDNFHNLNKKEQRIFSFIPSNASFIYELKEVIECIQKVENICKNKGLSQSSVKECLEIINKILFKGNTRMIGLGEQIKEFLNEEVKLTTKKGMPHNNSSDIIESFFGKYKERKSPNKLYGVTSHILLLPLYTKLLDRDEANKFDFKKSLEAKKNNDIEIWKKENLSPNLMTLRTKQLKKTG